MDYKIDTSQKTNTSTDLYIQYIYFWLDYIIVIFNIKKKVKY